MWHRAITCPVCHWIQMLTMDQTCVWVSHSGGRFLTVFQERKALHADGSFAQSPVLMGRWHRGLWIDYARAVLMDLILMDSILPRLVVSRRVGRLTSVIRVDERNQRNALMQRQLMPADDEVDADFASGQWSLMPRLTVIHPQQQAAAEEVWTS